MKSTKSISKVCLKENPLFCVVMTDINIICKDNEKFIEGQVPLFAIDPVTRGIVTEPIIFSAPISGIADIYTKFFDTSFPYV